MSDFFDKTTRALSASLNLRQLRSNVISSNVANAETPGYQAKKVDFENALARALDLEGMGKLQGQSAEHFPTGTGALSRIRADVYENPDADINNDGNTVNIEREMTSLAENSVMYKAAVQLINKKLAALKYAVTEGGR
jgi:flagellar basal-body rod protein FlgB